MGQRANLIVVREGGTDLYYSHWRANTLDRDLFWGPEHALAFIRRQRSRAEGAEWLDDKWAEGGAILDPAKSRLLWFGGEDILYEIPRRRVLLGLMARAWKNWDIAWAHEGIADLADAAGVPREQVLVRDWDIHKRGLEPPPEKDWVDAVLSAGLPDGRVIFFPLADDIEGRLWDCEALAAMIPMSNGHARLDLGEWTDTLPTGGAHVDLPAKEAIFWTAKARPEIERRLAAANPLWKIRWLRDRYESHLEAAGAALRFPKADTDKIVEELHKMLMVPDRDHSGDLPGISEKCFPGRKVEINAFGLRDDPLPLGLEERERIWAEALRRWKADTF